LYSNELMNRTAGQRSARHFQARTPTGWSCRTFREATGRPLFLSRNGGLSIQSGSPGGPHKKLTCGSSNRNQQRWKSSSLERCATRTSRLAKIQGSRNTLRPGSTANVGQTSQQQTEGIRIFNNQSWTKGGRLYSRCEGSYQLMPEHKRLEMKINGEPVAD
jgi:hypothetical protein